MNKTHKYYSTLYFIRFLLFLIALFADIYLHGYIIDVMDHDTWYHIPTMICNVIVAAFLVLFTGAAFKAWLDTP